MKKNILLFYCFLAMMAASLKAQEIRPMPADSAYGVVHISVCNLREEGKFTSGMSTQALLGMPVKVLQYNGWYEIQTPDDYTGWVHRMVITPMSKERYNEWNRAEKIVVTAHYGFTYEKPDEKSQTVSDVVAGNRLKWEGSKGHFYKVSYPDGRQAYISKSISQPETKWRASLKQDVESIIETAYTMIGIPYLWAGTSSKGVDCSGLVRTVLFMHDIIIPRDASQQAYVGERIEITSDFANVQRGDLVFFGRKAFSGRKEGISHVGIYLGNKQFIHALGDVHISSFEPADKNYDEFNKTDNMQSYFKSILSIQENSDYLYLRTAGPSQTYYDVFYNKKSGQAYAGPSDKDTGLTVIGASSDTFYALIYPDFVTKESYIYNLIKDYLDKGFMNPLLVTFKIQENPS